MIRELDAATTFNEVQAAGQRYGRLVGAQTARTLILLATAAIAQSGLIARLMKLPRATQASAALAAETGGVGLEAVGAVKGAQVLQGGVAITVEGAATGAVGFAMAAHGEGPGASSSGGRAAVSRPPYKINPARDPNTGRLNSMKTPEPPDAASVYENSILGPDGKWYGQNARGGIYRYHSDNQGTCHFSGSTGGPNPLRLEIIPIAVRRIFGRMR